MTRTHVALLRGVNVGGHNKVPMPVLREAVESLGHGDVATYIQSGNVVFTATAGIDEDTIARQIQAAISERAGVSPSVVVLHKDGLTQVIRNNPFPDVSDHRMLHAVVLSREPDREAVAALAAAVAGSCQKGSRDEARVIGRALYLWTPDGFATSILRRELDRGARRTPMPEGTARNWATITKLAALLDG